MTINLTPIARQFRNLRGYKFMIVGTMILVIAAGIIIASIDVNSIMAIADTTERIIEGADFSKIPNVIENIVEGSKFS